jgi:histidyl-tRNA synthetase
MKLSKQPVKGSRDFYPEDMRLQNYIFSVWRTVCESFGYEQYDTPILEPTDIYLAKGNEEIVKEQTYTFDDRGGRSLTLRTEMTPSVSRLVANKRQEFGYPLRLYSMPQCWRYERTQRGRGREFYQLNVDIFGIDGIMADLEVIQLADSVMQAFGANRKMYSIEINSRRLTKFVFWHSLGIRDEKYQELLRLIDKRAKLDESNFNTELEDLLGSSDSKKDLIQKINSYLNCKEISDLPKTILQSTEAKDLQKFLNKLNDLGVTNAFFSPSLIRGFDYYTDIVFEMFDAAKENNRSLFGGGRYDGLVGMFGVEPVATVGFGMGDIPLQNFLTVHGIIPDLKPSTDIYLIGLKEEATSVSEQLRQHGLNVATDIEGRKLEKSFKTAEKLGITYALVVGEKELDTKVFEIKNLKTGEKRSAKLKDIADIVRS